jgi:hypothetical protein
VPAINAMNNSGTTVHTDDAMLLYAVIPKSRTSGSVQTDKTQKKCDMTSDNLPLIC